MKSLAQPECLLVTRPWTSLGFSTPLEARIFTSYWFHEFPRPVETTDSSLSSASDTNEKLLKRSWSRCNIGSVAEHEITAATEEERAEHVGRRLDIAIFPSAGVGRSVAAKSRTDKEVPEESVCRSGHRTVGH